MNMQIKYASSIWLLIQVAEQISTAPSPLSFYHPWEMKGAFGLEDFFLLHMKMLGGVYCSAFLTAKDCKWFWGEWAL